MNRIAKIMPMIALIGLGVLVAFALKEVIVMLMKGPDPVFEPSISARVSTNEVGVRAITTDAKERATHWPIAGLGVSLVLSMLCLIRLWRRSHSIWEKIFWTAVIPFPFIGPLFFAVFFRPPPVLPEGEQASVNPSAFYGGGFR
jgi:hypothetical protein